MSSKELDNSSEASIIWEKYLPYRQKFESGEADFDRDFDTIVSLLQQAAELGHLEAQSELADIYRSLVEDESDEDENRDFFLKESYRWTKKAAEQGHLQAQFNLAIHFRDGIGTSANKEQAFQWFLKAAENGFTEAKHNVAVCCIHGLGTAKDPEKALYWLEQASNDGHAKAKIKLAANYIEGTLGNLGLSIDKEKGLSLLREAASSGDEQAQTLLHQQEINIELQKDQKKGVSLIKQAAASGDEVAKKTLEEANRAASSSCYVATCVYGSYDCPEVWTLRRFRDNMLAQSWFGRAFICVYYVISPSIVKLFGNTIWFNRLLKPVLDKLIAWLQKRGVESSPYSDKC